MKRIFDELYLNYFTLSEIHIGNIKAFLLAKWYIFLKLDACQNYEICLMKIKKTKLRTNVDERAISICQLNNYQWSNKLWSLHSWVSHSPPPGHHQIRMRKGFFRNISKHKSWLKTSLGQEPWSIINYTHEETLWRGHS